jgi:hypothetical protein
VGKKSFQNAWLEIQKNSLRKWKSVKFVNSKKKTPVLEEVLTGWFLKANQFPKNKLPNPE